MATWQELVEKTIQATERNLLRWENTPSGFITYLADGLRIIITHRTFAYGSDRFQWHETLDYDDRITDLYRLVSNPQFPIRDALGHELDRILDEE